MEEKKYVIVRGNRSSVFFGVLLRQEGQTVELGEARRIWYWVGAYELNELATLGPAKPEECKFSIAVDSIRMLDAVEIIPCSAKGAEAIKAVPVWKLHE